ncbi:Aminotransferase-like plant mobile domain-containing protein [Dioscorea alata]|uniref:Aminotransferase-like plant mobile domain-containing protein n=1 Tax=Dioscorea alata TaxID=55571 RepID=A0ACB7V1Q2_DIOAL|nr:Aminotransferase-like plant mobile domain-containing protein [Dioscorea alata]
MTHTTKGKLIEPLYKPFDDQDKVLDGISISRHYPIYSKNSEKSIRYLGNDFNEWTSIPVIFREIDEVTPTYFRKRKGQHVILLNPYESTPSDLNLDTLGHWVITDPTASIWARRAPFHYYTLYPLKYKRWAFEVTRRSAETLKMAGILGPVTISTSPYGFDSSIAKTITGTWCLKTNTFVTPFGELGISLWDLRCIEGLPIIGKFYEEYVPPNRILYSKEVYPSILKDLFNIYQWIDNSTATKIGKVTYVQWPDFFCKSPQGKRRLGDDRVCPVSQASKQCKLATFLCIWLCCFVMPCRSSFIRPEVFVIAAKLAKEKKLSLAPAVLACICTNLDIIISQRKGSHYISIPFPCYYFYGWITSHFPGTYSRRMALKIPNMGYILRVGGMHLHSRIAWGGFLKDIQVSKHPQDTGLKSGSKFYIPSHKRAGRPLYLYAQQWSTHLHTSLKTIYNNLNEQDNPPQRKRDVSSPMEQFLLNMTSYIRILHMTMITIPPLLDVNPPVESPQVEAVPFAQTIPEDSTPKATFADDNPSSKCSFKHEEHCATRTTFMNPSHPQSSDKNHVLQAAHEYESLREEIIKHHKTTMLLGVNTSATRDKVFEVLDIAKLVQDMKDKEKNPHMQEKNKLKASARVIEGKKLAIMVTTQSIDEAKMRLAQTQKKLQELEAQREKLKAQEEEDIYLINSSLGLLKSIGLIEEVDKSLAIIVEKLEALGGSDDSHLSSSLEQLLANYERLKSQL